VQLLLAIELTNRRGELLYIPTNWERRKVQLFSKNEEVSIFTSEKVVCTNLKNYLQFCMCFIHARMMKGIGVNIMNRILTAVNAE
jgi:hypothetical protein